jgi:putative intracellular protease/amidase
MIIAIGLYPGFTALDAIGPYQVFTVIPDATVVLCGAEKGTLDDDHGLLHLHIDTTFADVPRPDVLLVPGGNAARGIAHEGHPVRDWVRDAHPHTTWTTSVCTGALILASAGLLDGQPATTHWAAYDELAGYGAQPTEQRIVQTGRVITGAGVSAGIDLALTLAAHLTSPEVAQAIQLGIEYDPRPPFDSGAPSKADPEIRDMVAAALASRRTDTGE